MACDEIRNDKGEVIAIACGSSWGIGVYEAGIIDGEDWGSIYGFPPRDLDPHDFSPDYESCTSEEITAWEAAKAACPNH